MFEKHAQKYANNGIPFGLLSGAIVLVFGFLVLSWTIVLLLTREKELLQLRKTVDYQLVFPHILNIVPYFPKTATYDATQRAQMVGTSSALRVVVLLVLIGPMITFHAWSIVELGIASLFQYYWIIMISGFVFLFTTIMGAAAIFQEVRLLSGKQFQEL